MKQYLLYTLYAFLSYCYLQLSDRNLLIQNKKHIDASVKERSQTLVAPQKKFVSVFYVINILTSPITSNRQTLIVRRENDFRKFHNLFGFIYHVSCLP